MARVTRDIPVESLLARQTALWEMRRRMSLTEMEKELEERPWNRGYITISRQLGSLGNEIAARVAELLGWQVFDRELVHEIAVSTKMREQVIESLDERQKEAAKSWVQGIIDSDSISSDRYAHHLVKVIASIAQHGQAVIIGRGANFVLDPQMGLRVRIVAPRDVRLLRILQQEGLSEKEARKRLRSADNRQIAFIRHYFHQDVDDSHHYDLILNTAHLGLEAAAQTIRMALVSKFTVQEGSEEKARHGRT